MGRHTLKAGYEFQSIETVVEDFHPKYGQDIYDTQFSRPSGTKSANYYNTADFLFGARAAYVLNNPAVSNYSQRMHFWYLQDDIKLLPNLTVNVGLRYEYATPQWERDYHAENFDPAAKKLINASSGSIWNRSLVDPDRNNFAPRLGLAWRITPKTVLRSGYGVSYVHFNRMGGANLLAYNGPWVVQSYVSQFASQKLCTPNASPYTCFRPTEMGYPAGFTTAENYNPAYATVNYIPRGLRTGYLQSWHIGIQRELARNYLLDVAYIGNDGQNLLVLGDYNQAPPNAPGQSLTLTERRPISGFDAIQISFNGGFSNYHGVQARLEHKHSAGLYLLNSFTWSKAIDNASGHLEAYSGDNSSVNYRNLAADKGLSSYDQTLDTTTLIWEAPVGKGRRFASGLPAALDAVAGGWRLSAINTLAGGTPINLCYDVATTNTASFILTYRPNLVGDPMLPASERTPDRYFRSSALQVPAASQPFGSAGRNIARGRPLYQMDLGVGKDFRIQEQRRLQFRAECFNLLNKTNLQAPNSNLTATAFGTTRSAYAARQIQFALKFVY